MESKSSEAFSEPETISIITIVEGNKDDVQSKDCPEDTDDATVCPTPQNKEVDAINDSKTPKKSDEPTITDDNKPSTTDDNKPTTTTDDNKPTITDDNKPTITDDNKLSITDDNKPTITDDNKPTITDDDKQVDENGNENVMDKQEKEATDENANKFVYDEKSNKSGLENDSILLPLMFDDVRSVSQLSENGNTNADNNNLNNNVMTVVAELKLSDNDIPCMLCEYVENEVDSKSHKDEYLCHLIVEHCLVIADVKLIADLRKYAIYWKKKFEGENLETFCSKIRTNTGAKDVAKSEEYFLLCDALPEDKEVREELQLTKLKQLLLRQEFERKDDGFKRMCPFCTKCFQGNRLLLFNHMTDDHNFNIGHPDNIVNVRELLDDIEKKLDSLHCLFCEKVFKDRPSLREHMRKKSHRKLNPKNKDYDKYYIINYLELGKNWETLQGESERLDSNLDDWSGWNEESQHAVCFFCDAAFDQSDKVYDHMTEGHDFDFRTMRQEMQMSFYQQVKMINFIRRQVHLKKKEKDWSSDDITTFVVENLRSSTKWNHPQYYFPTYENDSLLCQLEDKDGLFEPEDTFVISEDGIDCRSIVNNSILTDLVVGGYFDV
ncbi:zinc finger protein 277 [Ciona intestinalis]